MTEKIIHKFVFDNSRFGGNPTKLNEKDDLSTQTGNKYAILGYSPRPGFWGDYYIIYCIEKYDKYNIINSFCSNTKIAQKITEYRMGLENETPIYKKNKKELYEMDPPIKFTSGEIKKIEGKNIKYREIFFK